MNRPQLTGKLSAVAATLAAATTLVACTSGTATTAAARPAFQPKLYTFTSDVNGFDTQTHFLDTGKSVVAFDAQFTPAHAQKALDYLKSKTSHPVKYVVVTHPNPDKFQGVPAFQSAGAVSIASTATASAMKDVWEYKKNYFVNVAKTFTEASYPALPSIDKTFNGHRNLTVDGVRIDLEVLRDPGVSTTQTIATIPSLKSVIVGDLVHHGAHAWLEGGIVDGHPTPTIDGWKRDLDQIKQRHPANWTVYGGRGAAASIAEAISEQKKYLTTADSDVKDLVASLSTAQRKTALADPSALASQLSSKLSTQFPSYTLPYMIGYGSYGLIMQHLAD
ncbi:MBL fold metallo-hydrolase [Streptomyces sp. NPDC002835]